MALHISWYNTEQTAFYVRYEPGWTWAQHHAIIAQIHTLRQAHGLSHSLCLFDLRGTTIPFDSPAGEHYKDPREDSFIVIVLDNAFTRTIAQLIIRGRGHQHLIHLVGTREEGEAVLNNRLQLVGSSSGNASRTHHP